MNDQATAPVAQQQRLHNLDIIRGFALLGILVMNIQSFAMPSSAYLNPTSFGDLSGINLWVWNLSNLLADQKFMAIFSLLFGAGICLFAERAEAKLGKAGGLHYRRMSWLLLFGLMHGYLIWYGDILYTYALAGMLLFPLRNKSPRTLVILAIILLSIPFAWSMFMQLSLPHFPDEAIASMAESWSPTDEAMAATIAGLTGSLSEQWAVRSAETAFLQSYVFLTYFLWRAAGMMLLGMALYKWGVLQGKAQPKTYKKMMVIGFTLGLPLVAYGIWYNFEHDWRLQDSMFGGGQFNYWGSIGVALAYVGLWSLLINNGVATWLQQRLSAVGQMAFTNYLMQSILCSLVFFGVGFGLIGELERWQQILVVAAIWIAQLIYSPIWLSKYRFGPMEWLWRSLTYWQRQPMRRK
ncbi:MAG: hypothetical protein DHS20C11_05170 [Lysobacteraceae bacterium]|nr:MAG: hypothetical protein DHS20C11_05170 [Xanthomonadaceae bacterium]